MTEFIKIQVPVDRVLDVYRFLGTYSVNRPTIDHPTVAPPIIEPSTVEKSTKPRHRTPKDRVPSGPLLERSKTAVKVMGRDWTTTDLSKRLGVHQVTASRIIKSLLAQEWIEQTGPKATGGPHKARTYTYSPAPEVRNLRNPDPPEVTGRGAINGGRGAPVVGTGKQAAIRGDVGKLVDTLRKQGWICERTGGNHIRATKGGQRAIFPATPSDHRALANARAELRRKGANV